MGKKVLSLSGSPRKGGNSDILCDEFAWGAQEAVIDRTVTDEEHQSADTTRACFQGYADCVEGAVEKGVIIGSGVYEPGKVKNTHAMEQAYEMGKNM